MFNPLILSNLRTNLRISAVKDHNRIKVDYLMINTLNTVKEVNLILRILKIKIRKENLSKLLKA